jgi:NAD+ kinase
MIIAIFHNTKKKQSIDIALEIRKFLESHSVMVVAEDEDASFIGAIPLSSVPPKEINFLISLGGDGTILRLFHKHPELNAPIMAINHGSLGFMADITVNDIFPSLKNLLDGNYSVQSRIVIEGKTSRNETQYAVNDIVVHRAVNPSLIDLAITVDDCYLNTFSADGMIVSTPSGSTAYSLAAGGPIVTPELDALVLTPINPHTISNRPIVLRPKENIKIEYIKEQAPIEITFDGFPCFTMNSTEILTITHSNRQFKLVIMPKHDYFATLRNKLGWAGKIRIS